MWPVNRCRRRRRHCCFAAFRIRRSNRLSSVLATELDDVECNRSDTLRHWLDCSVSMIRRRWSMLSDETGPTVWQKMYLHWIPSGMGDDHLSFYIFFDLLTFNDIGRSNGRLASLRGSSVVALFVGESIRRLSSVGAVDQALWLSSSRWLSSSSSSTSTSPRRRRCANCSCSNFSTT